MTPETQVFWLEARASAEEAGAGLLCQRHAESMVVPRGWTLDDRRDPDLHLFKPPSTLKGRRSRAARKTAIAQTAEQLRLGVDQPATAAVEASPEAERETVSAGATATDDDNAETDPWTPSFDTDDDLDGLLSASSPLLSRAFHGDGRPPTS